MDKDVPPPGCTEYQKGLRKAAFVPHNPASGDSIAEEALAFKANLDRRGKANKASALIYMNAFVAIRSADY